MEFKSQTFENLSQRDRANTHYACLEDEKWFGKCDHVVELANSLLFTFPLRLRDNFEEIMSENTPPIIYDFIIFCSRIVRDLQEELTMLMEVQSAASG